VTEKCRDPIASLGVRCVVFATEAESWDSTTEQNILEALVMDSRTEHRLTKRDLFVV
jgi:hypothetical protein